MSYGVTAVKSEKSSILRKKPSKKQKPDILSVSVMLTPSEIAQLQQEKKDDSDFFQKEFAHLKEVNSKYSHQGKKK